MSSGYFVQVVVVSHRELSLTVLDVLELTVPQFRAHIRAAEGGPCPRHSSRVPGRDQRSFLPPVAPLPVTAATPAPSTRVIFSRAAAVAGATLHCPVTVTPHLHLTHHLRGNGGVAPQP